MKIKRQHIWLSVGLLLLFAVAVVVVVYLLRARDWVAVSALVAAMSALATAAGSGVKWLWAQIQRTNAPYRSLDHAADELAKEVRRQWEQAACERRLMRPSPISVLWQWSRRPVTGPIAAAVGEVGKTPFAPLPEMAAITEKDLREGTIEDLFKVYGGLGSGRLMILGEPGAGKSGAAIRLLLDALNHRAAFRKAEEQAAEERAKVPVPVPVLFTLHGWDPNSEVLADWLAGQLTRDYALLRAQEYGRDAAAHLIADGYIAGVLDGLDEIAEALRPVALRQLEQARFRLVVLTRSEEMVAAVSDGHLQGAAALELRPIQAEQAAEYLTSTQTDPAPPPAWQRLIEHLRDHSDDALAQALQTPLMVTLVRDTYDPGDPVDELIDGQRFARREAIENHLLDRVLPAAYAHRPDHPTPAYTLEQARRWLGHLARRMNTENTRDLAWWQIPRWVPAWPRVLATVLACALVVGLVIGSGVAFARALVSKIGIALTIGLVIGFMGAFDERILHYLRWLRRSKNEIRANLIAGLVCGFTFGLLGGLVQGLVQGLAQGLVFGLVTGSVVGLVGTFGERSPQHVSRPRWSKTGTPINLVVGLLTALIVGLMYGLVARNGLGSGLVVGLVAGLMVVLALGIGRPSTEAACPINPRLSWHWNRQFGLVVGLMSALVYGLGESLAYGLGGALVVGLVESLAVGITVGLVFPATWQVALASAQLWRWGEAPARLLRFLEDARDHQILRTVGQVYQFRHSRLQDWLAEDDSMLSLTSTLPITIYLSDESAHEQVEAAVEDLLAAAGCLAAHTAESRLVLAQDAMVTTTMLQNLGPVLVALQPTQDAVIRAGALLIVKVNGVVAVHQLTPAQQLRLDHQPQLAQSPHDILSALEEPRTEDRI